MNAEKLLEILHVAERLKDTPRHCYTSGGRRESVAEHSWRIALMAYLVRDEFPDADMDKVILMCLIHDLGEAFTGDIPTFLKTGEDEKKEEELLTRWSSPFRNPSGAICFPYIKRWQSGPLWKPVYSRPWTVWKQ